MQPVSALVLHFMSESLIATSGEVRNYYLSDLSSGLAKSWAES